MTEAKTVRVGTLEMEYVEAGARRDGAHPFVLVHGFTGSRDDFADVLPTLGEEGWTLTPDNRGHGGTTNPGTPEGYSLAQMVDDLAGFLDAVDVDRCVLLGHSLGGMVALRFVLARPERVASLILMDTSSEPMGLMAKQAMEAIGKVVREQGMGPVAAGARSRERAPAQQRSVERMGEERYWQRIETKLGQMDPEAFATLGVALADHTPVTDRLGEIACPTLVLVGAEDVPFVEPSRVMADTIPDARLVVIPDAAHSPQFENEAAWLDAVLTHRRAVSR